MKWYSYKFYKTFRTICEPIFQRLWDNNWPKATIMWQTDTRKPERKDIRTVFNCVSKTIEEKIKQKALEITKAPVEGQEMPNDEKAFVLFNWVQQNTKYTSDQQSHLKIDYWQTPDETWSRRTNTGQMTGDCEDMTLLLLKMYELAGLPLWRIKAVCGTIREAGKDFGHCYAIYLREEHNEWACLDTTFHPELCFNDWLNGLRHKESLEQQDLYKEIWWTFNQLNAWCMHDILLKDGVMILE